MGKLNRGNLLATLKKLKKIPRPKVVIANPAVQAICGGSSITPNKKADLKAVIERRRAMLGKQGGSREADIDKFMEEFDDGFSAFCKELATNRSKKDFVSSVLRDSADCDD